MPMMVQQRTTAKMKLSIAIGIPVRIIQKMLATVLAVVPSSTTSFPNGAKVSLANLKHCFPSGIPIIVTHQRRPRNSQSSAFSAPPKIIHKIFPNVFKMNQSLSFSISIKMKDVYFGTLKRSSYILLNIKAAVFSRRLLNCSEFYGRSSSFSRLCHTP